MPAGFPGQRSRVSTERAAAASGRFELTTSNRAAVAGLCRRLDGVPLAIELAAVRTRILTAEQIHDRLADRFSLLTGGSRGALPRHQTLRTTIDWSHDLLEAGERTLLRRLSVFAGRFTLEDVESVGVPDDGPAPAALDLLSSLVDKSLVMKEEANGTASYRMHETMREYARLELRGAGEEEVVELRCAEYYRSRCRRSTAQARYRLLEWLGWMDLEIDNVRSVVRRCLDRGDHRRGIDLATSLGWYWVTRATTEGVRWLDELLVSARGHGEAHGRAHFIRGFLAVLQADPGAARPALERAVAAAREAGHLPLLSQSLSMASIAETMAGDGAAARRLLGEAQLVAAGFDNGPTTLMLLQARSFNGLLEGDLEAARSASSEGARFCRGVGDLYTLENMLMNLGCASLMAGDLEGSAPLFAEALRIARDIDDRFALHYLLEAFGCHAAARGQARLAAQLLGAAETVRAGSGGSVVPFLAPLVARAEASAIATLGASKFEAEVQAGRGSSREAAVRLALGETARAGAGAAAADHRAAGLLGKRETQVAQLVAEGLTNRQIGAHLFISEHTVDSHIRGILNKLGFNSRAQIASWMGSSTFRPG